MIVLAKWQPSRELPPNSLFECTDHGSALAVRGRSQSKTFTMMTTPSIGGQSRP
jgi:hypothetical protein